jgi:hypothetical protein
MVLSGLTYLVQGWVVGSEGFSRTETFAIVLAFVLDLAWMIWLVVVAWRLQDSEAPLSASYPAAEGSRPCYSGTSRQRTGRPWGGSPGSRPGKRLVRRRAGDPDTPAGGSVASSGGCPSA